MKKCLAWLILAILPCFASVNDANLEQVKAAVVAEFRAKFPQIFIQSVDITTDKLPKDFAEYEFIRLGDTRFERSHGYLRAEFKTPQNLRKNVFFRYFLKAKLEVLRANKDFVRGDRLQSHDYTVRFYDFDKIPANAINKDDDLDLIARTTIKKNAILRKNMFKENHLVKKNATLKGLLKDGDLTMQIEVNALESGDKGDTIKVRAKDGRVFQGMIIDKTQVNLQ